MQNETPRQGARPQKVGDPVNFSPLDFNESPEITPEALKKWGRTLAIAPHPDDESLGCGGTLALLAKMRVDTAVMWVSDGAASHPNSKTYAPPKLTNLREAEAKLALDKLGVGRRKSYFLRLPDGNVPFPGDPRFEAAVDAARHILEVFQPQTLLLPWRRDPHRDHRATWQILSHASKGLDIQQFEYLVWAFERAAQEDWPQSTEASGFTVDISSVQKRKMAAIYAHASQTTHVIKDDPEGFWLSPEVISHFENPHEAWVAPFCSIPEVAERGKARSGG
jgi:LmbE family N-acetylglucosaminyl deacetylase